MIESLRVMLNSAGKHGSLALTCPHSHIAARWKQIPVQHHSKSINACGSHVRTHTSGALDTSDTHTVVWQSYSGGTKGTN